MKTRPFSLKVKTLFVQLAQTRYPIHIGESLLEPSLKDLQGEIAVVADSNVSTLPWFDALQKQLKSQATKYAFCPVPAGESSKSFAHFSQICSTLAQQAFSRQTVLIAIGGGVIGDLAGFVAASYLRGIRFIQIPTTLLACVDSSVGGKTGINLPEGKNLVGAFYHPEKVIIDTNLVTTLPPREFAAGMAEVIKYGMIHDAAFLEKLAQPNLPSLQEIITRCVEIKAKIVSLDEKETSGPRSYLNFGHTVGHAIEQISGYGQFLHGEAVAIGMRVAAEISHQVFGFPRKDIEQLVYLLQHHHLPYQMPKVSFEKLKEVISRDKKSTGTSVKWVLLRAVAQPELFTGVADEILLTALKAAKTT